MRTFVHEESYRLVQGPSSVFAWRRDGFYQDLVNSGGAKVSLRTAQSCEASLTVRALLVSRAQPTRLQDCQQLTNLLLSQSLGAETLLPV